MTRFPNFREGHNELARHVTVKDCCDKIIINLFKKLVKF